MSLLPDGRQAGLFARITMDRVADCLVRWGNENTVGRSTLATYKPRLGVRAGWEFVSRRAPIPYRAFLVGAGEWTAFFDNNSREFLAQAELYILCERLHVDTCFFGCPDDDSYAHFCHFRWNGSMVKERQVMVYYESGWVFSEQGDPLPFEDLAAYKRRRKKDRLTREMLLAYGAHLGAPLGESAQFGADICLLEWRDFNKAKPRESQ